MQVNYAERQNETAKRIQKINQVLQHEDWKNIATYTIMTLQNNYFLKD